MGPTDVTYCKVREEGGDQVNINLSGISITIQCVTEGDRGQKKHLHWAMKGESSREDNSAQLASATSWSYYIKTHTETARGGTPVSAGIMEIDCKV